MVPPPCGQTLPSPNNPKTVDGSDKVSVETSSSVPSREEIEKVARRRYQHPEPFVEGKFWWVFIRQDDVIGGKRARKRKRIKTRIG